ncbi:DUF6913 domain-containing protein [Echinicola vietnamensis]|uniref:Uncharacterized protein n=1 Tax=Echinicola vietnamensis (strain DSM 17526 / LMG 23754 / KMM 6221) TaxID=926556 RepID=L0G4D3_ECHVK|nr:hypothetical protein [Echinicola vietnamensis]AGA80168.1 hypothetical protein Echvi_3958 [Echinicola vietnamensis DSM 17526]
MKWIKKFFVGLKIQKNKDQKYEKSKKSIEEIKSIHILANSYENLAKAEQCVATHWPGITISGMYYHESKEDSKGFSIQNFSLFGKPDEALQDFIDRHADILMVTTTTFDPFMHLVVQRKPADYKIGFRSEIGGELLDLMLEKDGNNLSPNIENLLKYLKKII